MKKILSLAVLSLILTSFVYKHQEKIINYYSIPEVINFDSVQYKLSASYHPSEIYYKQEYIPAGENADHFNKMITIDFVVTNKSPKDILAMKINELQERKKNDPVVHYEIISNPKKGEYILDFILSQQEGGKVGIVERNVYRYKNYTDDA